MGARAYRQGPSGQIKRSPASDARRREWCRCHARRIDTARAPNALIVTAVLDPASTGRFDELRSRYFPAERLVVGAHVTLFHHLPGDQEAAIREALADEARRHPPLTATVSGARSLGRGVAYDLECPALVAARARLAEPFTDRLTSQDREWRRAHVTVQNKVTPEIARATLAELRIRPPLPPATVLGFGLWRYLGGPWEAVAVVSFGGQS